MNAFALKPSSPQNFDWSLVRSFLATLDQGSLMGAARVLQMSQPTVGRHIGELESQLGVVLFERTGRGLVPTAMALQLAVAARGMEAGALQLSRTLWGAQTLTSGTVRITASVPVAVYLLPPLLVALRMAQPDIQVELVSSNEVSNLLRREADIAVRMVRPEQASLVARKLGDVRLGAYAHRSYLARRGVLKTYMARTDPDVLRVLPGVLDIPPIPMWLAVHREIRTSQRIRAVFDFLAEALPRAI